MRKQFESLRSFIFSALGAGVLLLAFEVWINDLVAMPLRVVSTSLAEAILTVTGYDVIRQGTGLLIDGFLFNVDVACSGSQTLRMMLAAAIVLVGTFPLVLLERGLALVMAVIIAVIINGARVGALIISCLYTGSALTENTFTHQAIGVIAYIIALLLFLKFCRVLAKSGILHYKSVTADILLAAALLAVLFLPYLYENYRSWRGTEWNPYNRYGFCFVVIAAVLYGICSRAEIRRYFNGRVSSKSDKAVFAVLLTAGCLWTLLSSRAGYIAAQGPGLLLIILGLLVALHSWQRTVFELPVLAIMILGLVKVPLFIINISGNGGRISWSGLFLFRLGVAVMLSLLYIFLKRKYTAMGTMSSRNIIHRRYFVLSGVYLAVLLSLGISLLWQIDLSAVTVDSGNMSRDISLTFPEQIGVWKRKRVVLKKSTEELLGGRGAEFFVYQSEYALPVEVLSNYSGGDRHNMHPPEYCLTGAGWKIVGQKIIKMTGRNSVEIPITWMELSNDSERRWFAFWFYDGSNFYRNYLYMLGYDILNRLGGEQKDWSVYRVIAEREEDLQIFLEKLFGSFEKNHTQP